MRNRRQWLFAVAAIGLASVGGPAPASADEFYAGHLRDRPDSQVLVRRHANVMKQAVARIRYEDCKVDGEATKTLFTSRELKHSPISGDKFSIRKRVEGPQ